MGKPAAPRRVGEDEAEASARHLRISPRKLNLVAQLIRGQDCGRALAMLQFSRKRIALDVRKVLQSAIANAENNHQLDVDRLFVSEATVGKTMVMRRWTARGRGRSSRIEKSISHIRVVVRERPEEIA